MSDLPPPRHLRAAAIAWLAYLFLFPIAHRGPFNDMAAVFVLVPLVLGAWLGGVPVAVAGVVLMWPLQSALFLLGDHGFGWDMVGGLGGFVALVGLSAVTILAGMASERVNRLEQLHLVKDRFVASISHEVRNPLTGVVGLAEMLRGSWHELPEAERRELVDMIAAEGRDMQRIVTDLLDLARLESGRLDVDPKPVDLAAEVEDVGSIVLDRPVPVVGSVVAVADPARVRQILRNLLTNAAKHGGSRLEVVVGVDGGRARLEVRDDGPGVADALLDSLFAPFASTGGAGSTGLGLTVSRQLARAMGGEIGYRRDNGWTVFRLELPLATSGSIADR